LHRPWLPPNCRSLRYPGVHRFLNENLTASDGVSVCRHDRPVTVVPLVACYLTVSKTDQTARPLHNLRVMGGKDESRSSGTIEAFHYIEQRDSGGRVQIRRGFIRQD